MYFLDDNLSGKGEYYMEVRRYEIPLRMLKKYFTSERNERVKYFSTLVEKFRNFKRPVIFYLLYKHHEIHRGYCMAARIYETIATMIFSREITSYLHA